MSDAEVVERSDGVKEETPVFNGRVLVVDDELVNRKLLRYLLKMLHFEVVEVENGAQAVEMFDIEKPDIILMDVMMPVMDGYEATSLIKAKSESFVPIIVLTALTDEQSLSRCVEAGADDFLTKPYDATILGSKIRAMMRIRELTNELGELNRIMRRDQIIAEQVFNGVVAKGNVARDKLKILWQPAGLFSGDVVLSAYDPGGSLHVLLGDFTGHGLAAALGALPTAEVFKNMVSNGYSGYDVISQINERLCKLLPTNMFMTGHYVVINYNLDYAQFFNCAMHPALILDGKSGAIRHRATSRFGPLGIIQNFPKEEFFERVPIHLGDYILAYTDGLAECRGRDGELFGDQFIFDVIDQTQNGAFVERIEQKVKALTANAQQDDDISAIGILCEPEIMPLWDEQVDHQTQQSVSADYSDEDVDGFEIALTLQGERLSWVDPIPILMKQLKETVAIPIKTTSIFVILTELYVNALDHGVLGLDSKAKQGEGGFETYLAERKKRLENIRNGSISIALTLKFVANKVRIIVRVTDSGPGFDVSLLDRNLPERASFHGRGIALVNRLCESLKYYPPGNTVEAVFVASAEKE